MQQFADFCFAAAVLVCWLFDSLTINFLTDMNKYTLSAKGVLHLAIAFGLVVWSVSQSFAQDTGSADKKFSMNVGLNSDAFFGFYPTVMGSYKTSEKLNFTFYGILWSGGTGAAWGNWTEFGVGVGFPVGKSLYINPQIGLLNGSLTSGLGNRVAGEGVVPNVTISLNNDKLQGEIYAGYYMGLDHGNPRTNNYLHYWANGGYKISSFFSLGLLFEHLRFAGGKNHPTDASYDFYMALGPYVQFAQPQGSAFARFSVGADLRSNEQVIKSDYKQPSYFKLTVGYGF